MLQPFEVFKKQYIDRLMELKKVYLVTQTYERAFDHFENNGKIALLVSDYDDPGLAKIHSNALKNDKYGAILHLEKGMHKEKLIEMLSPDSKYQIYWAIVKSAKELKERIDRGYKDRVRMYIEKKTNWRISKDSGVNVSVELIFGELYLILKFQTQTLRVKFEEIEKI